MKRRGENSRSLASAVGNLTGRQREVLQLLGECRPRKLIALELGISENTARVHIQRLYGRLGIHTASEAVRAAAAAGLV